MSVTVTFHDNEAAFLVELLKRASNEFSSHGCNDYTVKNTDENWAMLERMEAYNCRTTVEEVRRQGMLGGRPTGPTLCLDDWFLVGYLGHVVQQAIDDAEGKAAEVGGGA